MARTILVTGGAGYIGSHTVVELLQAGDDVVVVDNFDNSSPKALDAIRSIAGRDFTFVEGDVSDGAFLDQVFTAHDIHAVIHFAAHKAVGESVAEPMKYYRNNLGSTIALIDAMDRNDVRRLVFSSSCTVYGNPEQVPITEDTPLSAVSPYGRTKLINEDMLRDLAETPPEWRISLLRYFNPVGAHESGDLGEDPTGVPQNLMPFIMQVAVGRRDELQIFGDDYNTTDGTCIRDYIHVVDLAQGHLAAIDALDSHDPGCNAYNLGTGVGSTVLEVLKASELAVGKPIANRIVDRRAGDAEEVFADPTYANQELSWKASRSIADMCRDHWNWQQKNPNGFS